MPIALNQQPVEQYVIYWFINFSGVYHFFFSFFHYFLLICCFRCSVLMMYRWFGEYFHLYPFKLLHILFVVINSLFPHNNNREWCLLDFLFTRWFLFFDRHTCALIRLSFVLAFWGIFTCGQSIDFVRCNGLNILLLFFEGILIVGSNAFVKDRFE